MRTQKESGKETCPAICGEVIDFIEGHLTEDLDLDMVADAVHYSKYHLHRLFVNEVGLTIHDYVQRRRLTEAARLLVFSDKSILESPCSPVMRASRRSRPYSRKCIRRHRDNIGRTRCFIRCS